jgi:hypothetical protein
MTPNLLNSMVHVTESPPNMDVHLLTPKELCRELSRMISDTPCPRTIRRWKRRGLPHHEHPANGRSYYLLPEVVAWLVGEPLATDFRVRANSVSWKVRQRAG